jgi:hypothetical protein
MADEQVAQAQEVAIKAIEPDTNGELSELLHSECSFCGKDVALKVGTIHLHERFSRKFYCAFCLRHRFFTKNDHHILMTTFRGIIGYYYHAFYRNNFTSHAMYYSEISEYIDAHVRTGLLNPVFYYDPESYLWFIDFSRVGKGKGKELYEDVLKTISDILFCFNLPHHISSIKMCEVYEKWKEAIDKFYQQRYRPAGKRILMPTLSGCGAYESNQSFHMDSTRDFVAADFKRIDK